MHGQDAHRVTLQPTIIFRVIVWIVELEAGGEEPDAILGEQGRAATDELAETGHPTRGNGRHLVRAGQTSERPAAAKIVIEHLAARIGSGLLDADTDVLDELTGALADIWVKRLVRCVDRVGQHVQQRSVPTPSSRQQLREHSPRKLVRRRRREGECFETVRWIRDKAKVSEQAAHLRRFKQPRDRAVVRIDSADSKAAHEFIRFRVGADQHGEIGRALAQSNPTLDFSCHPVGL